jgi:hypothetical protein
MSLIDCSQLKINKCYTLIGNYSDCIPNNTYLGEFSQISAEFLSVDGSDYYYIFTHSSKIIELNDTYIKTNKVKFQLTTPL